ncbi:hypothetical protein BKA67DRAFT_535711 [Truncatella angustata]|uniref:Uncharacterized protein n=1 Tax=Truncatella angustata TaxID=152316 RepID=A0A9P8ULX5_9PEZI|nr:uncharacterized protein BKA67DRAFT_535711 [Truncatella angustata]KAH6654390.1 hypothetical protein BKA67DRAFT_535711 [Truncatella angustata]
MDVDTSYHAVHGEFNRNDAGPEETTTTLTFDPSEEGTSSCRRASPLRNTTFTDGGLATSHPQHRRQQSTPTLSPLPLRVTTRTGSPVRGHLRRQSDMPLTGDGRPTRKETSPSRLGGWWSGNSTPPVEDAPSPDTTPKSRRDIPSNTSTPRSTTSTQQAGLGFFASSVSALKTRLTTNAPTANSCTDEELASLNIEVALQPPEQFGAHDTFSPAAYKNLQANAIGLCTKMQNAYRERTISLQELQAERAAEKEEAEETHLRVENLKMQLEHMARKADEQQQSMRRLMAELEHERKIRQEERLARDKILGDGSMVGEDLGVDEDERRKWRKSGGTERSEASGFDTDSMDSVESESVFSRSRSPTIMTSATESHFDLPSSSSSIYQGKTSTLSVPQKPKMVREMSTLQKLMKNISGETLKDGGSDGCRNCRGQDSSAAWDTVGLLRDENRALKQRVAELEIAIEGVLDLVNGVGV